jgi:hypothetical protein
VKHDFGSVDILVHSLANGPEVLCPTLYPFMLFFQDLNGN